MSDEGKKQDLLLETTDCLEAIGTLKSNKNLFFFICLICLLLLQASFWLMATHHVNYNSTEPNDISVKQPVKTVTVVPASENKEDANTITDPNTGWEKYSAKIATAKIDFNKLAWMIRICNYLLIVSSVIYAMSLLFGLMISLVGRLGGISHVTKAFFVSLLFIVVLIPWPTFFKGIIFGTIFRPAELLSSWLAYPEMSNFERCYMYFRFVAMGVISILLLLWAQLKSMRWSKNTLKRLGIVG
ncbi:MAG: hypothetical protein ABFD79_05750 [Phycisphaerales bacterium]